MQSAFATFSFPTATLFGPGTTAELPMRLGQMGCRRPLVVTDPGLLHTRSFEVLTNTLGKSQLGKTWELYHGVHSNPIEQDVVEAAQAFRAGACDAVIAFGGGSALDVGKACRLFAKHPELNLSKFNMHDDWSGLARCVCVPTTAGTGSEVARNAVITRADTQSRVSIFLPRMLAKLVILDPVLTEDLPPELTAATGLDALTHCIEAFTSPVFQPFCDGIALEGIRMIVKSLPKAWQDGKDLEARGRMLVAAAMGGVAFQKDLGAAHSLAHPLSAICGMHHGMANAVCLPHVMRFNAAKRTGLYRRVGLACGLNMFRLTPKESDQVTIEFIEKFIRNLGLERGLRAYGVKDFQIDHLSAQALADPCHLTNPVSVSLEDFKALYQAAL